MPTHSRRPPATLALSSLLALLALATACSKQDAAAGGEAESAHVPAGAIVAFAGESIPAGWTLCDGRKTPTNIQTPDLRDRFVMGTIDPASAGQTGGSDHHDHGARTGSASGGSTGVDSDNDVSVSTGGHGHKIDAAEHLPPFVRLAYIMKD